ncbi:hypothetical protein NITMOv2_2758 [Nitrospira moscoviensis]|uniref:Uncharacterized protein n=1 Tax=Nitrospira moscoviensis TaxID=42253 RepID=A0A0K2GDZ4_NITMO|nr:hypothetical protein NITMOv2_2758 [Nitrospira moscoviensis]
MFHILVENDSSADRFGPERNIQMLGLFLAR